MTIKQPAVNVIGIQSKACDMIFMVTKLDMWAFPRALQILATVIPKKDLPSPKQYDDMFLLLHQISYNLNMFYQFAALVFFLSMLAQISNDMTNNVPGNLILQGLPQSL